MYNSACLQRLRQQIFSMMHHPLPRSDTQCAAMQRRGGGGGGGGIEAQRDRFAMLLK